MNWFRSTFEISHTTHKPVVSMEGIRGFAVFLVFLVHYVTLVDPWLTKSSTTQILSTYVRSIGNIGVDLFFVLSGYLIYGMLIRKKKSFGGYIKGRIQRIYPTFTAVFVIYLLLSAAFPSESKIPDGWKGVIFVIQNFLLLPGLFDITSIITVAWSLSYEFFYYLLIPLLIGFLRLREWGWEARATLFCCASILLFAYFALYGGHIRLLMFISGILLFEVTKHNKIEKVLPIGIPALTLAILSVILLNAFEANGWWQYALLFVLFFLFCLDCFSSEGLASKIFKFSPMRWLGNMSYSYYLIHGLTLKFLFMVLSIIYAPQRADDWMFWVGLPVAFITTLVPSAFLFVFIEKPYSLGYKTASVIAPLAIETSNTP
jgi:exopolysaccharide production protein ExoZ